MTNRIGKYTTHDFLGSGAFGSVIKASKKGSDRWFAIKRISKQSILRTSMAEQVKKEINIMKTLDHPNIVRTEEVLMSTTYVYICMEHVSGGELNTRVVSEGKLSDVLVSRFTRQLCEAMEFCHNQNICHRDIKPQNILIDHNDNVKLVDFGFASFMEAEVEEPEGVSFRVDNIHDLVAMDSPPPDEFTLELNQKSSNVTRLKKMRTYCGTVQYMAPEISAGGDYFGDKVDMWAIGMVMYFMLSGGLPSTTTISMDGCARGRPPRFVQRLTRSISSGAGEVLRNLLVLETERYSATEILMHPWLQREVFIENECDVERSARVVTDVSEEEDSDSPAGFSVVVSKDFDTNGKTVIECIGDVLDDQEYTRTTLVSDDNIKVSINTSSGIAYLIVTLQREGNTVTIHVEKTRGECSTRRMKAVEMAIIGMIMA